MNYQKIWDKVLKQDEKVIYSFTIGSSYITVTLIFWGLLSLALAFISPLAIVIFLLAFLYLVFYLRAANAYAFTNKRIVIHRGWLSTETISVDYSKITDVLVREPFFAKILTKTGSIFINTAGSSQFEVVLTRIENPYEIKKILDEIRA